MSEKFLQVRDLSVQYRTDLETVYAVNHINFELEKGQTIGLVGETGAGKKTTALTLMRLLPEKTGRVTSGTVTFEGQNIYDLPDETMHTIRGHHIAMIFQDPMTSLNPVMTVGEQIAEALELHNTDGKTREQIEARVDEVLRMVGIPPERKTNFPHQFSGGMKQRVVIAMALVCEPDLLIADEPTTALDVTIQAQVLDLIKGLRDELGTAMILITHDLGIVADVCDKVCVIYAGRIVESGTKEDIFDHPTHPYTKGLFAALPDLEHNVHRLKPIEGLPPDPSEERKFCDFMDRCPHRCRECKGFDKNTMIEVSPGHFSRC